MRILHVNKFLYRRGGAEGYMEDVAELQHTAGEEVFFWGMADPENSHVELSDTYAPRVDFASPANLVSRAKLFGHLIWSPLAAKGIDEAIRRVRPDVAHLHNVYHQLSPSILGPLRHAGVPVVMTLHDYKLVCPTYLLMAGGRTCEACLPNKFWNAPLKRCRNGSVLMSGTMAVELSIHRTLRMFRSVDAFICPSRFLMQKMIEGGMDASRLHHLPHFIDVAGLEVKDRPGGGVVLAGRLSPEKGVDVAIRAAAHFPDGLVLDIAGDGVLRGELERLAAEVAPGKVSFHGRLPKADLFALLRASSVAVVPSVWYENQPLAVLEAFACGVPVIASALGGLPELVTPGRDGHLVPPGDPRRLADAVTALAGDPERALAMGRAGRRRLEVDFTPGAHLAALTERYQRARGLGAG